MVGRVAQSGRPIEGGAVVQTIVFTLSATSGKGDAVAVFTSYQSSANSTLGEQFIPFLIRWHAPFSTPVDTGRIVAKIKYILVVDIDIFFLPYQTNIYSDRDYLRWAHP